MTSCISPRLSFIAGASWSGSNSAEAAEHYRRALKLYERSDPELKPLVEEAEAGLARVAGDPAR